jgi:hypothetical protein
VESRDLGIVKVYQADRIDGVALPKRQRGGSAFGSRGRALDCNAFTARRNGLNKGFMGSEQIKQVLRIVMYIGSYQSKVCVTLSENGGIKWF